MFLTYVNMYYYNAEKMRKRSKSQELLTALNLPSTQIISKATLIQIELISKIKDFSAHECNFDFVWIKTI